MNIKRTLLYEEVVEALYQFIDRGEVTLGGKFPPERELVNRWNISRNVLREAFHVLEERGLVTSQQGRGRFLRAIPDKETFSEAESLSKNLERVSLTSIYEVRQGLEKQAVALAAKNATDEDLEEIVAAYHELQERFRQNNNTIGEFGLHRLYAEKSKNQFLVQLLNIAHKTSQELMSSSFLDVLTAHTIEESLLDHGEIIRALRDRDDKRAEAMMSSHIQRTIDMLNRGL